MKDQQNGSPNRLIASEHEMEEETRPGRGSEVSRHSSDFERVYSMTNYPASLEKRRCRKKRTSLRGWCLGLESKKPLEGLHEYASEWDLKWGGECPSAGEISVDEERVKDPKGIGAMEMRWWNLLLEILGTQGGFARFFCPSASEASVAEAVDQLEREVSRASENSNTLEEQATEGGRSRSSGGSVRSLERRERAEIFWTRSRYEGVWDTDLDVPSGKGVYRLPYGVTYAGEMHDGQLEGRGVLRYPDGSTVEGVWRAGRLLEDSFKVTFRDALTYYLEDWDYCTAPDRRFHVERLYGLRGAGRSHMTQGYPTRCIPAGCYDTGDGFFDPATRCVVSPTVRGKVLRIPTNSEAERIKETCRKAWDENVCYLPDAFANIYDSDDLESLIPTPNGQAHLEMRLMVENGQKSSHLDTGISQEVLIEKEIYLKSSLSSSSGRVELEKEERNGNVPEFIEIDTEGDLLVKRLNELEERQPKLSILPPGMLDSLEMKFNVENDHKSMELDVKASYDTSENSPPIMMEHSQSNDLFESNQESIELVTKLDHITSEFTMEENECPVLPVSTPLEKRKSERSGTIRNIHVSFEQETEGLNMGQLYGEEREDENLNIPSSETNLNEWK